MASQREDDNWHQWTVDEALRRAASRRAGLSTEEASRRLLEHGRNVLLDFESPGILSLIASQFASALIWILIVAAGLAGLTGEWADASAILAIVVANAVFGFFQEFGAERSLAALRKMTAPTARVRRDGRELACPAADVCPGDILLVEAGDIVAADARILVAEDLTLQEAMLTGESEPVQKSTEPSPSNAQLGDRKAMLFAGTAVAAGRGEAVVTATAMATEIGKIALLMRRTAVKKKTPLEARLDTVGKILGRAALALTVLLFLIGLMRGLPLFDLFLTSISLAVAAVPEGLPAVVTIALAVGVQRMARRRTLVRRLLAVETLGATNVICSDKTGTLTVGEMTVRSVALDRDIFELTGEGYRPVGEVRRSDGAAVSAVDKSRLEEFFFAVTAVSTAKLIEKDGEFSVLGDPTEGALLTAGGKVGIFPEKIDGVAPLERMFPFDSTRKRMSAIRRDVGGRRRAYVKGAPDVLIDRCVTIATDRGERPMTPDDRARLVLLNATIAEKGQRVLAAAKKEIGEKDPCDTAEIAESGLVFLGLIGMQDPPRPDARDAVAKCRSAGIRVVMITGDHPSTARSIAGDLGILRAGDAVWTGADLESADEATLSAKIDQISVFARVTAAAKLRIVHAWQKKGGVVAMTGDGVNDAPALKGADIGIAMGKNGTEVTKEASSMVLTDDRFATIVDAVEEGRGVYENIKKALLYLLAGNCAELLLMTVAVVIGVPLPLLPMQLLWINLVTDGLPALCLAMDPIDRDVMKRHPRLKSENIIDRAFLARMLLSGILTASVALAAYLYALPRGDTADARGHAFGILVFAELLRSFGCRSDKKTIFALGLFSNGRLFFIVALSIVLQWWIHQSGALVDFLSTPRISLSHTATLFLFGAIPFLTLEVMKGANARRRASA